jgi:hypothetical protein
MQTNTDWLMVGGRVSLKNFRLGVVAVIPTKARTMSVSVMIPIQIGDRFTDPEGEWEVVSQPTRLHGAKSLRARVRRTEQRAAERDVTWPVHVRVDILRTR